MKYVRIDLHTNRFTCCYLCDNSKVKQIETFNLDEENICRFFSTVDKETYVLKEIGRIKNRIHSLLKENLYPFTKEYIIGKKTRAYIRSISKDYPLSFQINMLMDTLSAWKNSLICLLMK